MLQLKNLSKSFSSDCKPILQNLSLYLKEGDFCVLLGNNGSGKSTLLKTISGEYTADSGKIVLNQKEITPLSMDKRATFISSVSQDVNKGTVQELTLLENLSLSLMRGKKASFFSFARTKNALQEKIASFNLGLEHHINTPLMALSGGQKQIIATVMATLCRPQLLLLDEHCSALDPKAQSLLMDFTAKIIQQQNITTLMITHHLQDALTYGNRLIMINNGKVIIDMDHQQKKALSHSKLLSLFHDDEDRFPLIKEYAHA